MNTLQLQAVQAPAPVPARAPAQPNSVQELARLTVAGIESPNTRRSYSAAITSFLSSGHALDRAGIQAWLQDLQTHGMGSVSLNVHLAAVRRLVLEASVRELITLTEQSAINAIQSRRVQGVRTGNWTTVDGIKALLSALDDTPHGTRDKAILACLVGCGMRRSEITSVSWSQWTMRENRYVWLDVRGKGGRVRTIPAPDWVAAYVNTYLQYEKDRQAGLHNG